MDGYIANASVIAKCSDGSGFLTQVITAPDGSWSGEVETSSLPCALQVSNGTTITLHSYAPSSGIFNITPLTELVIAQATRMAPENWFAGSNLDIDSTILESTISNLQSALVDAGFTIPTGSPLTTQFQIGDPWDLVLDNLQSSIDASSTFTNYRDLVQTFIDGNSLIPEFSTASNNDGDTDNQENTGNEENTDNEGDTGGEIVSGTGNYDLTLTVEIAGLSTTVSTIQDIAKPSTQQEFCSVETYDQFQTSPEGFDYSWRVDSCSFNGTEGDITATATYNIQGFAGSYTYNVNYLYTAN